MIHLIKKSDRKVLAKTDGIKNAIYYIDMIAFYDAYSSFVGFGISNLPNYCVIDGQLNLDGLCLLIKDNSSKFGFVTLDLTLEYLKYLYYSIAKYSTDGFLPEREVLTTEFVQRKNASKDVLLKIASMVEETKNICDLSKSKYEMADSQNETNLLKTKKLGKLTFFVALLMICVVGVASVLYVTKTLSLLLFVLTGVVAVAVGILLIVLLQRKKSKNKQITNEFLTEYEKIKADYLEKLKNFNELMLKYDKITVDVNSYFGCFKLLEKLNENNVSDEFLNLALDFNIDSVDINSEILNTFNLHNDEINKILGRLKSVSESNINEFSEIYDDIMQKNYLKLNNFVKVVFLNKFIENAKHSHFWKLNYNGNYVNPFDVDVKSLERENVAFLENKSSIFIRVPFEDIENSSIVTENSAYKIPKKANADAVRKLKLFYLDKFYDVNEVSKLGDVFYNLNDSKKKNIIDLKDFIGLSSMPKKINLKIMELQANSKLENSHNRFLVDVFPKILKNPDFVEEEKSFGDSLLEIIDGADSIDLTGYKKVDAPAQLNDYSVGGENVEIEVLDKHKLKYTTDDGDEIIGFKF